MKITVYTTKTCPYFHQLTAWLKDKNVEFTEYKVDENPYAAQMMVQESGQMGVPFSTIEKDDGEKIGVMGFDRATFEEALTDRI